MAKTQKEIDVFYRNQKAAAKEKFKLDNNLKVARGWKASKEFKRISRNEKQANYRRLRKERIDYLNQSIGTYDDKGLEDKIFSVIKDFKDSFSNTTVYEEGAPFYNVLSYGSKGDKAAVHFFKRGKGRLGKDFFAIIDKRDIGGEKRTYNSLAQYQIAIQELYQDSVKRQSNFNMDSDGIQVSIVEGEHNKNTYLYLNVSAR